jgi:hypothetical protein
MGCVAGCAIRVARITPATQGLQGVASTKIVEAIVVTVGRRQVLRVLQELLHEKLQQNRVLTSNVTLVTVVIVLYKLLHKYAAALDPP